MQTRKKSWWALPYQFALETIAGSGMFFVIAVPAVVLSVVVDNLERNQFDLFVVIGLRLAEYALFTLDLVLFVRYLYRTGVRTWQDME